MPNINTATYQVSYQCMNSKKCIANKEFITEKRKTNEDLISMLYVQLQEMTSLNGRFLQYENMLLYGKHMDKIV